jgi:hypothetical protein
MQIELPKKQNGSGTEDKYPFDFDRVVRVTSPEVSKELFAALILPVVERFCQVTMKELWLRECSQ